MFSHIKNYICLLALLGSGIPALAQEADKDTNPNANSSIVRVNVTSGAYNFRYPWQKLSPGSRRGLGALIGENKVMVTAELIQDSSYIELERAKSGKKLTAKLEAVDYEANLALIVPTDDPGDFFSEMIPLDLDTSAKIGDTLEVWQFERNGSSVETEIRLSKVETGPYFLSDSYFLTYEASGPVQYRSGSFTLPVVKNGKFIGMLLSYSSKDQVAEILAAPVIEHFLEDQKDGNYEGFPNFGIRFSATLDDQFRKFLKLSDDDGGVYVSAVMPETTAEKAGIKQGDVLLEVNGHKIDSRGNYEHPDFGLLSLSHLVKDSVKVGDKLPVKLLRDGEKMDLELTFIRKAPQDNLIDPYMFDRGPKFLILGGLLFQELTVRYLETFGKDWATRAPFKLLYAANNPEEFEKKGIEKLVFLSAVLPSNSTLGYEGLRFLTVTNVNGQKIKHIKDLDEALKSPTDDVHSIEFDEFPYRIYVDAKLAEYENTQLLPNQYRINLLKRLE